MIVKQNISLLNYNTFGIDVNAQKLIEFHQLNDVVAFVEAGNLKNTEFFVLGGGSNLLFSADVTTVLLKPCMQGIDLLSETDDFVFLKAGAAVVWDDFVAFCVQNNWQGAENLSLIPGEVGASAVQNIGAYGVEAVDIIEQVEAVDLHTGEVRIFSNEACEYAYRHSIFKTTLRNRFLITSVVFRLCKIHNYQLNYQHLEAEVKARGEVNLQNIRATIIDIRQQKLPDTAVLGNAGSFFMNPVVEKPIFQNLQSLYPDMPHYYVSETHEKIPAAWLIDRCGWKGKQLGRAGVHTNQALVIVNCGGATGQEIKLLAENIQADVFQKFGIQLVPEVIYL
jgi:UDP-N-acetylmuramate dehydrogenase